MCAEHQATGAAAPLFWTVTHLIRPTTVVGLINGVVVIETSLD